MKLQPKLHDLLNWLEIPYQIVDNIPKGVLGWSPPTDDICWTGRKLVIGESCPINFVIHEVSHWIVSSRFERRLRNWGFEQQFGLDRKRTPDQIHDMETRACDVDSFMFHWFFDFQSVIQWLDFISSLTSNGQYFSDVSETTQRKELKLIQETALELIDQSHGLPKNFVEEMKSGKWRTGLYDSRAVL